MQWWGVGKEVITVVSPIKTKPLNLCLYTKHCCDFVCEHDNVGFDREAVSCSCHGRWRIFQLIDGLSVSACRCHWQYGHLINSYLYVQYMFCFFLAWSICLFAQCVTFGFFFTIFVTSFVVIVHFNLQIDLQGVYYYVFWLGKHWSNLQNLIYTHDHKVSRDTKYGKNKNVIALNRQ